MSIQKMALMMQKIDILTSKGAIVWERTEKDDVFQTSFPDFSIRVFKLPASGGAVGDDYYITIYDANGTVIESVNDAQLAAVMSGEQSYNLMKGMYETARGYALGVEQALDSILGELDKKGGLF